MPHILSAQPLAEESAGTGGGCRSPRSCDSGVGPNAQGESEPVL